MDDSDGGSGEGPGAAPSDDVDQYIIDLGVPEIPEPMEIAGDVSPPFTDGDYTCTTQDLSSTQQYGDIIAFASNSNTMFPGSIVGGESVQTGLFTPKAVRRSPVTISASLEGVVDGPVSATLEEPTLSAYREALDGIISAPLIGNTAAQVAFTIEEVHSAEQLGQALGLEVGWSSFGIGGGYDWAEASAKSRFVVNFTQTYYTVDMDVPQGGPKAFFPEDVTVAELEDVFDGEPPAYVASVTYGRLIYFAVESQFSSEETREALEFGLNIGVFDLGGDTTLTNTEVIDEMSITAFILGGNGDVAVESIHGVDGIRDFIESGGSWSHESLGAPIAYKLNYLADHSPARFALTSDYELTECERISQNVRVGLDGISVTAGEGGDGLEIYGSIEVRDEHGTVYTLMDRTAEERIFIAEDDTWPDSGEIGSAIIPVVPQPGHHFTIDARLWEFDGGNDQVLIDSSITRPFDDGWRDAWGIPFAQAGQQGELIIDLKPVP